MPVVHSAAGCMALIERGGSTIVLRLLRILLRTCMPAHTLLGYSVSARLCHGIVICNMLEE